MSPVAQLTDFDLFIRPTFAARNPGFDLIRLIAPSRADIELRQVSLGDESDFAAGNEEIFAEVAKGRFENGAGEELGIDQGGEVTRCNSACREYCGEAVRILCGSLFRRAFS